MWNNDVGNDEVAALLGELGQAQNMGMGGGAGGLGSGSAMGGASLFNMFADWVATGYDAGAMGLNGGVV